MEEKRETRTKYNSDFIRKHYKRIDLKAYLDDYENWTQAAAKAESSIAGWMKSRLNAAAERELAEGYEPKPEPKSEEPLTVDEIVNRINELMQELMKLKKEPTD